VGRDLTGENTLGVMYPQKGIPPPFAGIAREILPKMRGAIATTCRAAPRLAKGKVLCSNIRCTGPLRDGECGNTADASATALHVSASDAVCEDLAAMNPLVASDDFPLYDQVKPEHIMPGMNALISEDETTLVEFETYKC
jgi:hypothetical protein